MKTQIRKIGLFWVGLLLTTLIVNTADALDCSEAEARLKKTAVGQTVWRAIEAHGGCQTWAKKKDVQYKVDTIYHKSDADYEQEDIVKMIFEGSPTVLIKKIAPLKGVILGLNGKVAWRTNNKKPVTNKIQLQEAYGELKNVWDQIHWPFLLASPEMKLEGLPPVLSERGFPIFYRIRVKKSKDDWKVFYFDAQGGWLERIYFQETAGPLTGRPFLEVVMNFKKIDGILIPAHRNYYLPNAEGDVRGTTFLTKKITELRFDNGLSSKAFENPKKIHVKMKTEKKSRESSPSS